MKDFENMDIDLVDQLKTGHPNAYRNLESRWQKRIYNYALRFTNDHHTAQEIVQKAFIKVYQNIDSLKDSKKFTSWFYRIANNLCISEKRSQNSRNQFLAVPGELPIHKDGNTPYNIYETSEKSNMVHLALQMLAPEQKQVILMKEFEGLKFREIAEVLEESESTVKSRLYYGLDNLRKIITSNTWTKELYYE
jgi:RNA polymerase sigma-70 factor (ECF subfamily)